MGATSATAAMETAPTAESTTAAVEPAATTAVKTAATTSVKTAPTAEGMSGAKAATTEGRTGGIGRRGADAAVTAANRETGAI